MNQDTFQRRGGLREVVEGTRKIVAPGREAMRNIPHLIDWRRLTVFVNYLSIFFPLCARVLYAGTGFVSGGGEGVGLNCLPTGVVGKVAAVLCWCTRYRSTVTCEGKPTVTARYFRSIRTKMTMGWRLRNKWVWSVWVFQCCGFLGLCRSVEIHLFDEPDRSAKHNNRFGGYHVARKVHITANEERHAAVTRYWGLNKHTQIHTHMEEQKKHNVHRCFEERCFASEKVPSAIGLRQMVVHNLEQHSVRVNGSLWGRYI